MPADLAGQELGFLEEFLLVVFAEVEVCSGGVVEGEDVVGGFEFGDRDEADRLRGGGGGGGDAGEDGGEVCGEGFGAGGVDVHLGWWLGGGGGGHGGLGVHSMMEGFGWW